MSETVRTILQHKGRDVWSVSPDDSVLDALRLMTDKGIGALVVVDAGRLVGIVSERDCARKVVLQERSVSTPVREIMTSPVFSVGPDHTVDDCMRIVTARRIRHLPVVRDDHVIGVVSIGDLVRSVIMQQGETIQHLEGYIVGRYPA